MRIPGDNDDEDEGGMYDSVKRLIVHEQQLSSSPRKTAFPKVNLKKWERDLSLVAAQESMEEPGYEKVKKMKPAMDSAAPL